MAFNFNWSPLAADASFYTRAQELLTTALNKSPKPPIIVDDILVNELNLGSVPPDLEILEIGDLAEDRFRGIFKMCYSGDAFLTLKTRVQANPLNTYLSTRPSFASPEPLAAASGLTIPLKITLSDIKLSAFIILVFSKQKGLTLVFRNDPLESLKVSSTFDSIPFVRDYLQKEIEGQLRTLLMDEVPAIIHRLSLRLWVPEYRAREDEELAQNAKHPPEEEQITDPLASPPQDPVDCFGNALDAAQIASLSLDSSAETHSLFSEKNLLRLAALTNSHRTLSLFTPGMRDVVFRAWAGPTERSEATGILSPKSPFHPMLSRKHMHGPSTSTTYTLSDSSDAGSQSTRPTLTGFGSSYTGQALLSGKHGKAGRKRKHRVVNLRRNKSNLDDIESISGESMSATMSSAASEPGIPYPVPMNPREGELITPPTSPRLQTFFQHSPGSIDLGDSPQKHADLTPRPPPRAPHQTSDLKRRQPLDFTPNVSAHLSAESTFHPSTPPSAPSRPASRPHPSRYFQSFQCPTERPQPGLSFAASSAVSSHHHPAMSPSALLAAPFPYLESSAGGILEQAWMMKMAGEIARRVQDQKAGDGGFWAGAGRDEGPPPAYGV